MRQPLPQHVDDAALANLGRQPGEELEAVHFLGVVGHGPVLVGLGLGHPEKGEELGHIEGMGAVVVLGAAGEVANARGARCLCHGAGSDGEAIYTGHVAHDERFEALLAGVGGHTTASSSAVSGSMIESVSSSGVLGAASSGSRIAASRTSSLPVTTSATRRVR